jgi:type VII secretion-associated serine protease mycosin
MKNSSKNPLAFGIVAIICSFSVSIFSATIAQASNDPAFESQWGISAINASEIWTLTTGKGVTVAVIDSGSGPNPDLNQNLIAGRAIVRGRISEPSTDVDPVGHGTHVAGIIAGQRDNAIGISGIAPDAKILPIRILDSRGDGSEVDLAQAIRFAVDQGARVINLSLGGAVQTGGLQIALEYAAEKDVLVVAAAGNGGPSAGTTYPAGNDLAIAVTAVDQTLNAPSFNQRGAYIDISAPGINICSTVRLDAIVDISRRCAGANEPYVTMSGTSMATAHVSGVAALIFAARPDFSALQVREVMIATTKDIGAAGRDEVFGAGLIDAYAIFKALGFFPEQIVFPTVSSLGRVGQESVGGTVQIPESERLQWYRCLSPGDATLVIPLDCMAISRAQKNVYAPTRKDIGVYLRFGTLISVGGTPQMRFSSTTPKVSAIWTTISTLEVGTKTPIKDLVVSASKSKTSARVVSGPCKIVRQSLIADLSGTCKIRIFAEPKTPYSGLAQTVVLEIVDKNEVTN